MKKKYQLYIGNIGRVGDYPSLAEAKKAAREWFKSSGRAEKAGSHITDMDGEPIVSWDRVPETRWVVRAIRVN